MSWSSFLALWLNKNIWHKILTSLLFSSLMSVSCLSSLRPPVLPRFCVFAECQCHGHADSCHFSQRVWLSTGGTSGGVCNECRHNTFGRRCQRCRHGFRRHPSLPLNSPHACTRKKDALYSVSSCQIKTKKRKNLEWLDCRIHLMMQELWMKLNRTITPYTAICWKMHAKLQFGLLSLDKK